MNRIVVLAVVALVFCLGAASARQDTGPGPQVVAMTAKKYEFSPATVTVERGRPVRLEITAVDDTHGIEIKEFRVKSRLEKGKATVVEFTPDRTGEFPFKCSVLCGFGHGKMKGTLVVVEPKP